MKEIGFLTVKTGIPYSEKLIAYTVQGGKAKVARFDNMGTFNCLYLLGYVFDFAETDIDRKSATPRRYRQLKVPVYLKRASFALHPELDFDHPCVYDINSAPKLAI